MARVVARPSEGIALPGLYYGIGGYDAYGPYEYASVACCGIRGDAGFMGGAIGEPMYIESLGTTSPRMTSWPYDGAVADLDSPDEIAATSATRPSRKAKARAAAAKGASLDADLPIDFSANFLPAGRVPEKPPCHRASSRAAELPVYVEISKPPDGAETEPCTKNDVVSSAKFTSWMIRNLPNRYTPEELLDEFCKEGFEGAFDFLYLPIDFKTKKNKGYAFVNLRSHELADRFRNSFDGLRLKKHVSKKVLDVSPAVTQGFEALALAYLKQQSGRVQNPWFRPMIFIPPEEGEGPNWKCLTLQEGNLPEPLKSLFVTVVRKGKARHVQVSPDLNACAFTGDVLNDSSPRQRVDLGEPGTDGHVSSDESCALDQDGDITAAMQQSVQEFLRECASAREVVAG